MVVRSNSLAPGNERVSEMAFLGQIESAAFPCEQVILVIPASRANSSLPFTSRG